MRPDVVVEELGSMVAFLALESEWNALVEASGGVPFLRHECIRAWLWSFAPASKLVLLVGRDAAGKLVAALPLVLEMGLLCGLPARQLVAAANTHSSRFDLIALDPRAAGRAFLDFLGLPVGAWEGERSPYLAFPSSYEELLEAKSPAFRANLRRRRRQLEKMGALTVERFTGLEGLAERLDEGFALERSGWKGRRGTAIAQDTRTRAFYTEVAKGAALNGYLSLFFLRLDGRPIAFHFGLVYDGVYSVPKLAYDEELRGASPGLVLLEEAIKDGIFRGLRGYDFLGAEAEWKNKWSSSVRPNHWLFIFRDTLMGHALRKAKFGWLPAARRVLQSVEKLGAAE